MKNVFVSLSCLLVFVSSFALGQQRAQVPKPGLPVSAQEQSLTGTLEMVVGDPPHGSFQPPVYRFYLTQDNGDVFRLSLDSKLKSNLAEVTRLAGKRVTVSAIVPDQNLQPEKSLQTLSVTTILHVETRDTKDKSGLRQTLQEAQSGSKPWLTIYCKFADSEDEPNKTAFYNNMYSNSPGGLNHYWRENSYEAINIDGSSSSINWVDLPGTLESYMTEMTDIGGESTPSPDLGMLFDDCTAAADEFVDFSNGGAGYFGINMMFNETAGCCAWGGKRTTTLDGLRKTWGITWLPPWAHRQSVIAHEMGHAFGLPHSNNWDQDDDPYDNPWDVMSMSQSTRAEVVPIYGALSPHTNAYHKYELGWISGDRVLEVSPETSVSTTLDAMAQPNTSNHRMVLVRINENSYFTVEARKRTGVYETSLPDDAVIIYEVTGGRGEPSWAVDSDSPPADRGDNEGTMWRVGETFTNSTGDIFVTVDAETAEGFTVSIENRGVQVSDLELTALTEFYNSTGGDNWTDNSNWLVGDPCSNSWFGVSCGVGKVTDLNLNANNLTGVIPASMGNLTGMRQLVLEENQLSGPIPGELGNLVNLQRLSLGFNQLDGAIPVELGDLSELYWLDLSSNQLTGDIPPELGNLSDLYVLLLNYNSLSGFIPVELGGLAKLAYMYLHGNQLRGPIPPALGNQVEMYALSLGSNRLSGPIPAQLGDLANLNYLYLYNNQLSGPIPAELGDAVNLQEVVLPGNMLSGPIPTALLNLPNLVDAHGLDLDWNALYTNDIELAAFLNLKSGDDWNSTQTIAPEKVRVSSIGVDSITLSWDPIKYTDNGGGYRTWYATNPGGPYNDGGITTDKHLTSKTITGLSPDQRYYVNVTTETQGHSFNANTVTSDPSNVVSVSPTDSVLQMNTGLNDAWYYPNTTGQGFFITVFPEIGYVSLSWFTYDTERPDEDVSANLGEPGHRWLNALGKYSGNQAVMDISMTSGGLFDTATNVAEEIDGSITLTFTDCNNGTVEYDIPSINQQGIVPIQRIVGDNITLCETLTDQAVARQSNVTQKTKSRHTQSLDIPRTKAEPPVLADMNAGLNDAWFDPVTAGQGFFITVFPEIEYVLLSWFTYDTERPGGNASANLGEPGHRWFNALGSFSGNQAVMDISIASGGLFDTPTTITEINDGIITLTFADCENGTVDYDIPSINQRRVVPIRRIVGDNIALCEALNAAD